MTILEPRQTIEPFTDPHQTLLNLLNQGQTVYYNTPTIEPGSRYSMQDKLGLEIHPLEQTFFNVKRVLRQLANGEIPIESRYMATVEGLKQLATMLRGRLSVANPNGRYK